jgi:hypothetical protein
VPQTIFCLIEGSIWQEENTMWCEAERTLWHWLLQNSFPFILWRPNSELLVINLQATRSTNSYMYLPVKRRNKNPIFKFSGCSCGFLVVCFLEVGLQDSAAFSNFEFLLGWLGWALWDFMASFLGYSSEYYILLRSSCHHW